MRFAVISNIHANLPALQAVLAAIDEYPERIERIICAGDVVGLGPYPNEVLALLRERAIETVRGNYDDAVAQELLESGVDFPDAAAEAIDRAAVEWTRAALTEENYRFLQDLPRDLRIFRSPGGVGIKRDETENRRTEYRRGFIARALFGGLAGASRPTGRRILVVHGTTRALNEFVRVDTARSILSTVSREAQADVLISAHAGEGFHRVADGVNYIGIGSVGGPRALPGQAEYAVIDSRENVEVDFGLASYDPAEHVRAIVDRGLPPALGAGFLDSGI